jgi:hypothetical protein
MLSATSIHRRFDRLPHQSACGGTRLRLKPMSVARSTVIEASRAHRTGGTRRLRGGCGDAGLVVEPSEALAWLRDLPALWAAADDSGRRLLTEALFEKVEVLGVQSVTIHPTPEADAHGWSDAFGPVPLLLDGGRKVGTYGRGERI